MRKTTSNQVAGRLGRLRMFAGCSARQLEDAARLGTAVRQRAGQVMASTGGIGRQAFLVEEGHVAVQRDGGCIAMLGPGDIVGEMAVLSGGRRNATLVVVTDAIVTVYTPAEFSELLKAAPPVGDRVRGLAETRASVPAPVLRPALA